MIYPQKMFKKHSEDINRRKDMLSSLNDNIVKDGVFKGKRKIY